MKFAVIDGDRREPAPGLKGCCPGCGQEVLARCGAYRVWHWAHKGKRSCDPWWEPETEWHRAWKNLFPVEWQEIPMRAEDGELHIADIRTPHGLVIEFQHSAIKIEEQISREAFYRNMVWVVDGTRLSRDRPRINQNYSGWRKLKEDQVELVSWPQEFLPQNWTECSVPVLFDFDGLERDEDFPDERSAMPPSVMRDALWWGSRGAKPDPLICLLPYRYHDRTPMLPFGRERFLKIATEEASIFPADKVEKLQRKLQEREAARQVKPKRRWMRPEWKWPDFGPVDLSD